MKIMNKDPGDRLLTRAEVAEIFQVSPSTIARWADSGQLPSVRTLGGHRRYEAKAVRELAQNLMIKEEANMENALFTVPSMYADHHVIVVREALLATPGVEEVWASSAWQQVQVTYDPDTLPLDAIGGVLEQAGYPIGEGVSGGNGYAPTIHPTAVKDAAWDVLGVRVTKTNRIDLK